MTASIHGILVHVTLAALDPSADIIYDNLLPASEIQININIERLTHTVDLSATRFFLSHTLYTAYFVEIFVDFFVCSEFFFELYQYPMESTEINTCFSVIIVEAFFIPNLSSVFDISYEFILRKNRIFFHRQV